LENKDKQQDDELVRQVKKGNSSAFRQLVDKYKDRSLSLAASILKDSTLAEDVLQDVFVKVYHKLHTFKFNASFATWLYRIVVNTSYNELKKQKNFITPKEEAIHIPSMDKNMMTEGDQKKYIHLALQNLRADEALILRLFYLNELKIKEIQEVTGFKASKIKVDLHRGRENMYFQLKRLLGDNLKDLL